MISDEVRRKIEGKVEATMQSARGPRMAYLLEPETWSHHSSIYVIAKSICGPRPRMAYLLKPETWSHHSSIHTIAKFITSGGLRQLWKELKGTESEVEAVCEDEEVAYLGRCFMDMAS
ncbi:hypothetical protein HDU86_001966 [Geranomyces michiganensis]|nr:hypothetical protein HDU86_001966 [Geranomyces michiganensis]